MSAAASADIRAGRTAATLGARTPVITGIGALAPGALDVQSLWSAVVRGRCELRSIGHYDASTYPLKVAGEIAGFVAADVVDPRIVVQTDRYSHVGLAGAAAALRDAALDPTRVAPYGFGVVTASCAGGVEFGQAEIERLWSEGPGRVGPYQSIAWFYAATTGQVSIRHGLRGPCGVLVTDEAGGLDVLAHAARDIRYGADAMLAGGAEAPLAPFAMDCQYPHGLLSSVADPTSAYLPFSRRASGFVPAEGGAMFVVEDLGVARERGARVRAYLDGYGTSYLGSATRATAAVAVDALAHAIGSALAAADCGPWEVDVVFADGLGVPEADQVEAAALARALGGHRPPVTVPKAGFGRAYSGSAAIDVALAVLSLEHGIVPPTPNVTDPVDDVDLVVGGARHTDLKTALVVARGLSGTVSALVLRRGDGDAPVGSRP